MKNKEWDEKMRKRAPIIEGFFTSIVSIPVLLVVMSLIKGEYVEYTKYGQIIYARIINHHTEVQSGESEPDTHFIDVSPINKTLNINISDTITFQAVDNHFLIKNKERESFFGNYEIGDTVKIQLTNYRGARLLRWKNWQANQPANIKTKIWMFLLIIVLIVVFVGMNLKTFKIIRNKQ